MIVAGAYAAGRCRCVFDGLNGTQSFAAPADRPACRGLATMSAKQLVFQAINALSHLVSPDIVARVSKVMYFKEVFDRYGIDLVLDVGANGGQYAGVLRDYGFTGDIVSFEPVSSEFAKLAAAAKGDARWTVLNYALGSNEAEQTINIMASSVFSSFNTPSSESTSTFRPREQSHRHGSRQSQAARQCPYRTRSARQAFALSAQMRHARFRPEGLGRRRHPGERGPAPADRDKRLENL